MIRDRHAMLPLLALLAVTAGAGAAAGLDALSSKDASGGLRTALSQGIDTAVTQLGALNGFLSDPRVAIPLPPALEKADRTLRMFGMSGQADELRVAMNHAAEQAVAQSKPVFRQALQRMTLTDAKAILTGGDDAATRYFRQATSAQLTTKFKPIVAAETARLKLASQYDQLAGKAAELGLVSPADANLNDYVTARALDGLFSRIADEERAIRKDPLGQTNALLRKVFSSL
ncbi:MAG TPA: DUF4197 domain-containing protein [Steroidobacteraceae bacterium]|nr:DUF4197 domain-containing protein [Steroidobacteraceae bacterium]